MLSFKYTEIGVTMALFFFNKMCLNDSSYSHISKYLLPLMFSSNIYPVQPICGIQLDIKKTQNIY